MDMPLRYPTSVPCSGERRRGPVSLMLRRDSLSQVHVYDPPTRRISMCLWGTDTSLQTRDQGIPDTAGEET